MHMSGKQIIYILTCLRRSGSKFKKITFDCEKKSS